MSQLGYGIDPTQVSGGVAFAQWLTTLTGESPTSSGLALVVGAVTRVHKACPKRLVHAAEHGGPPGLACLEDGSSSGVAAGPNSPRKEDPTRGIVSRTDHEDSYHAKVSDALSSFPDLFRKPQRGKQHSPRHERHTIPARRMTGKPGAGRWIKHSKLSTIRSRDGSISR